MSTVMQGGDRYILNGMSDKDHKKLLSNQAHSLTSQNQDSNQFGHQASILSGGDNYLSNGLPGLSHGGGHASIGHAQPNTLIGHHEFSNSVANTGMHSIVGTHDPNDYSSLVSPIGIHSPVASPGIQSNGYNSIALNNYQDARHHYNSGLGIVTGHDFGDVHFDGPYSANPNAGFSRENTNQDTTANTIPPEASHYSYSVGHGEGQDAGGKSFVSYTVGYNKPHALEKPQIDYKDQPKSVGEDFVKVFENIQQQNLKANGGKGIVNSIQGEGKQIVDKKEFGKIYQKHHSFVKPKTNSFNFGKQIPKIQSVPHSNVKNYRGKQGNGQSQRFQFNPSTVKGHKNKGHTVYYQTVQAQAKPASSGGQATQGHTTKPDVQYNFVSLENQIDPKYHKVYINHGDHGHSGQEFVLHNTGEKLVVVNEAHLEQIPETSGHDSGSFEHIQEHLNPGLNKGTKYVVLNQGIKNDKTVFLNSPENSGNQFYVSHGSHHDHQHDTSHAVKIIKVPYTVKIPEVKYEMYPVRVEVAKPYPVPKIIYKEVKVPKPYPVYVTKDVNFKVPKLQTVLHSKPMPVKVPHYVPVPVVKPIYYKVAKPFVSTTATYIQSGGNHS